MVTGLDVTRSTLRSMFYGDALEGLNRINRSEGIRREDGSKFTDTIDLLEEHGYLDVINKGREEIIRARRSSNEILLFSADEEYELINGLGQLRRQLLTEIEGTVDRALTLIKRGGLVLFVLGALVQWIYFTRPSLPSLLTSFVC